MRTDLLALFLLTACGEKDAGDTAAELAADAGSSGGDDTASEDGGGGDGSKVDDTGDTGSTGCPEEVCDGVDNDCDGEIDEDDAVDAAEWYPDTDGDGYGLTHETLRACGRPDDAAALPDDCDDTDPEIHPEAVESCDGVDTDCDGLDDPSTCTAGDQWYLAGGFWAHGGGTLDAGPVGDLDGDGQEDIYLSWASWGEEHGWDPDGEALISSGPVNGDRELDIEEDFLVDPGGYLRGGVDLDGDGYDDLVYADFIDGGSDLQSAALWIVPGPLDLAAHIYGGAGALTLQGDAHATADPGLGGWDWVTSVGGWSKLASARDFDGDGVGDLLWGAYQSVTLTLGPITTGTEVADGTVSPDAHSDLSDDGVGDTTWLDDMDGDGLPEIALTWIRQDASHIFTSGGTEPSDLDTFSWDHRVVAGGARLRSAGDIDGDGLSDLAVGLPGDSEVAADAGAVWLVAGLPAVDITASEAQCRVVGEEGRLRLGWDARRAGDWTGDGLDEVAVAVPGSSSGAAGVSQVQVHTCPEAATLAPRDSVRNVEVPDDSVNSPYDNFAYGLAGPADLDGDGRAVELVITAEPGAELRYLDTDMGLLTYGTIIQPGD